MRGTAIAAKGACAALVLGGCATDRVPAGAAPVAPDAVAPARACEPNPAPPCFAAQASPLYQGFGWTHFVEVFNACAVEITCEVATTVDPSPAYLVTVPPGEAMSVRTRYGSNTPVFDPIVTCEPSG